LAVGDDIAATLMPLPMLLAKGSETDRARFSLESPQGERTFGFQCSPVADGSCVVVFQDITRIEETQRERNRLLQLANISEVMPAVLHELKNPLAAITLTLEVLLEDMASSEFEPRVHSVLAEVRRLGLTIDGLGRFRHEVRSKRNVAIDLAMREAAELLAPQAAGKGVQLEVAVQDMPLLPFEAAAFRAVVFNLVTNAVQACAAGQSVRLEASYDRPTQALRVTVRDTGVGMSAQVRARCTEMFFTTKPKGSGIGLALCAGVVEAVGGTITIESAAGQGTSITMTFPITRKED
jgi:signal transduction histidine kinase